MGQKYGFLIPDTYVPEVPNEVDMNTSSIFWGLSLGIALFTAAKAGKQSLRSWKRSRRLTAYVFMVWAVWWSSMVLGVLAWGFQRQYIPPSFGFYFCVALFWAFQIQFLLQIIINRLGLLLAVRGRATKLKWIVFLIILAINISVFIIWMPARLQINETWYRLNEIWDRCEKVIFAFVDGFLNFYFIYLVRSHLIRNGLTKYYRLYYTNLVLIFASLSLDFVLVGLMSLRSSLVYLSFHPVCYLLKLQIEMVMAELIRKLVQSSNANAIDNISYKVSTTEPQSGSSRPAVRNNTLNNIPRTHQGTCIGGNTTHISVGDREDDADGLELHERGGDLEQGIRQTD